MTLGEVEYDGGYECLTSVLIIFNVDHTLKPWLCNLLSKIVTLDCIMCTSEYNSLKDAFKKVGSVQQWK